MGKSYRINESMAQEAEELYKKGVTIPNIAMHLSCHRQTVRKYLTEKGMYDPERDKGIARNYEIKTQNHCFINTDALTREKVNHIHESIRKGDIVEILRKSEDDGNRKMKYAVSVDLKSTNGVLCSRNGWCKPVFIPYKCLKFKTMNGKVRIWREVR